MIKIDTALIMIVLLVCGISIISYIVIYRKEGKKCMPEQSQQNATMQPQQRSTMYILLGAPGAGKGTLSERCIELLKFKHISTGNLFRHHISTNTEIGKKVDALIKSGGMVPDEIVVDMVRQELVPVVANTAQQSLFLDGFPRTVEQAKVLLAMIKEPLFNNLEVKVVHLWLPSIDIVVDRLTSRVICSNKDCQATYSIKDFNEEEKAAMICKKCGGKLIKRSDDEVDAIRKRLELYQQTEKEIIDQFALANIPIIRLDAAGKADDIYQNFVVKIGISK